MARRFPKRIVVAYDPEARYHIIVGTPEREAWVDAEDGQRVAIYVREETRTFRLNPRLVHHE